MESVMNFLADNYIWFFVAAGILCFALIGFIIESRKKQKNEFKGESIEESTTTTETPVQNTVSPVASEPVKVEEPVQVVGSTVDMGGTATLGNNNESLEDTMEINDIPLASEESPKPSIEFYSGPIDMPVETPKPAPEPVTELVKEEVTMGSVEPNNSGVSATIGNPVSYEQVSSISEQEPIEAKVVQENTVQENVETTENNDIFKGFN